MNPSAPPTEAATSSATSPERMSGGERRAAVSMSAIFTLRLLGLFLIMPVFSIYAHEYAGHTAMLTGVAIGIYGLTQAAFQIPFGMLSDRIGRKRVITIGLLIFAGGSVVAALADTMTGVIVGRALQGLGAIAAAGYALIADLTREEHRTKSMAMIGISIGFAFWLAMALGPYLADGIGVSGIFWLTSVLALVGIAVLHLLVPDPRQSRLHRDAMTVPSSLRQVVADRQLLVLDFGIMVLHLVMTASFIAIPIALRDAAGLDPARISSVYLTVLLGSVALMMPVLMIASRRDALKPLLVGAIAVLALSQAALATLGGGLWVAGMCLIAYFAAFNLLEATLPSLVSRIAPSDKKGTALGAYSTAQYFGAFVGGVCGGWVLGRFGVTAVFGFCAALAGLWLVLALGLRPPPAVTLRLLRVGTVSEAQAGELAARLLAVAGVVEAVVVASEGVAYLKVDRHRLDAGALRAFSESGA